MRSKYILLTVFCAVLIAGSYYWGFLCGEQDSKIIFYDRLLADLSSYILINDAMQVGKIEQVKPMIMATIESDFASIVKLYNEYGFESAEHLRCAVSRRFRKLKKDGKILVEDDSLADYPTEAVSKYLETECLGEPSHPNWMQTDKNEVPSQK